MHLQQRILIYSIYYISKNFLTLIIIFIFLQRAHRCHPVVWPRLFSILGGPWRGRVSWIAVRLWLLGDILVAHYQVCFMISTHRYTHALSHRTQQNHLCSFFLVFQVVFVFWVRFITDSAVGDPLYVTRGLSSANVLPPFSSLSYSFSTTFFSLHCLGKANMALNPISSGIV